MAGDPSNIDVEPPGAGEGGPAVTLVNGADFCLSGRNGDILPGAAQGLFLHDTRVLSRLELRVDGHPVEALGTAVDEPNEATFFGRTDRDVVVLRRRSALSGLTERISMRNHGMKPRSLTVDLAVDADFAHVFEVKELRVERRSWYGHEESAGEIKLRSRVGDIERCTTVSFGGEPATAGGRARWEVLLAPGGEWTTEVQVAPDDQVERVATSPGLGMPSWRARVPRVQTDDSTLSQAVKRALEDLGSLRIFDPEHADQPIIAAGAPWFMSPFGRDSLLTAWMALLVDPELSRGVLETLARWQGSRSDPATEEEPGRIFHEMRFRTGSSSLLSGGPVYYGSVDATPLFVMLLGELRRWGLQPDVVDRLLPHADRALAWIIEYGDRDGDGFVEYERATPTGLAHQGWKDSWDGVRYGDGRVAQTPIALCEVQGYVYAAYLARAHFARAAGDVEVERIFTARARRLKEAFNRDFWLPAKKCFAVGLDGDKRPIDSRASNMGHCLWTGIIDLEKADDVAETLMSPAMFSGWGIRTLASDEPAYNPVSYHCGSVWPHDNAIIAAGLVRYGFVEKAHRVMRGILDVAAHHDGRLPELFSGLSRAELSVPAAYPTSCSPQAWAAATPLLFLRLLLRLDPWLAQDRLHLAPALPPWIDRLSVRGIPLGEGSLSIEVDGTSPPRVTGLSSRVTVHPVPRAALSDLIAGHDPSP